MGHPVNAFTAKGWQVAIWDRLSETYASVTDRLFEPVVRWTVESADPQPGQSLLDLGCGTGSVAVEAAPRVGSDGYVLGVDPSPRMLRQADRRRRRLGLERVSFALGSAEDIAAADGFFDVLVASLSLMYVIDRVAAAAECARVLRPGGRFVAAVWSGSDEADIVRFQEALAAFAPEPPVRGVGPGALADPQAFVSILGRAGIDANVNAKTFAFELKDFAQAWEVMAEVTASRMEPERREEAKTAIRTLMWQDGDGPRVFTNRTLIVEGVRR